jgi:uncharacterized membrane protein
MRIRYISWLILGIAAAFLVVASQSFALSTVVSVTLGISVGATVLALAMAVVFRNHLPSAVIALAAALVGGWTIVASQVFSQSDVQNLSLASALAIAALAIVGLTVHELDSERVVHSLEVGAGQAERAPGLAA